MAKQNVPTLNDTAVLSIAFGDGTSVVIPMDACTFKTGSVGFRTSSMVAENGAWIAPISVVTKRSGK